ncbi:hypothetical protein JX580_02530 [Thiomicrospira microaerophila]|uniref:hypothetical protein n=1 Tax=Thiomicrospira microaerophila TaxID=406020 RepID=UPI00200DD3A0|nr:hypothetical protein [Thiomicrospira microaerophila]UQB42791.1 hypothetical protein JX580_02530 [Thiomicrospira microaerophila]
MKTKPSSHDWEEDLSKLIGDPLAFQLGYRVRQFKQQTQQIKQDSEQMLSEYFRYELDLLPSRSEIENFNQQVNELENRFNEIDARIERMTKAQ